MVQVTTKWEIFNKVWFRNVFILFQKMKQTLVLRLWWCCHLTHILILFYYDAAISSKSDSSSVLHIEHVFLIKLPLTLWLFIISPSSKSQECKSLYAELMQRESA